MRLDNRNKFLVAGLIAALWLCYNFAIANTVEYYSKYSVKADIVRGSANQPAELRTLTHREKQLDVMLEFYNADTGNSFQNGLLKELSVLSEKEGLSIVAFQQPHNYREKGIHTTSYLFSLKGSFNGILRVVNTIENNTSLGFIKHIAFIKKKNYKTNTQYLVADIILQKTAATGNE